MRNLDKSPLKYPGITLESNPHPPGREGRIADSICGEGKPRGAFARCEALGAFQSHARDLGPVAPMDKAVPCDNVRRARVIGLDMSVVSGEAAVWLMQHFTLRYAELNPVNQIALLDKRGLRLRIRQAHAQLVHELEEMFFGDVFHNQADLRFN